MEINGYTQMKIDHIRQFQEAIDMPTTGRELQPPSKEDNKRLLLLDQKRPLRGSYSQQ
jgi:hypothetical protein